MLTLLVFLLIFSRFPRSEQMLAMTEKSIHATMPIVARNDESIPLFLLKSP